MSNELLYATAVQKWGVTAQVNQLIEECAELILVLRHYHREKATLEDVASELADVSIMVDQISLILGGNIVSTKKREKLARLKNMLERG